VLLTKTKGIKKEIKTRRRTKTLIQNRNKFERYSYIFGKNGPLIVSSAQILGTSSDQVSKEKNRRTSSWYTPGLPDGLFSNQKSQFGAIFEGLRLENVEIFFVHFDYFRDIWDIL
jgi:hypothetical protein